MTRPHRPFRPSPTTRPCFAIGATVALMVASFGLSGAHAGPPENLGLGLRRLAAGSETAAKTNALGASLTHAQVAELKKKSPTARLDGKDRVLLDVYFNGRTPIDEAVRAFEAMGCQVVARADWYRQGAISLYAPLDQAGKIGLHPGVDTANLSLKPKLHAGIATSQGVKVLKSDQVNQANYKGSGITVGVLSDSFDTARLSDEPPATTAADDAADNDLPGAGNPNGHTVPVYVLQDYGNSSDSALSDEGRAMCQIVHDVAPSSQIAFATAFVSEIGFAQNIIVLAVSPQVQTQILTDPYSVPTSSTGKATVRGGGCKVICDDVGYYDEPMFSDGVIAQAVDYTVNKFGVSYFSSAGNDGSSGYAATFTPAANTTATQAALQTQGGIAYTDIPAAERAAIGSFHAFGTDAKGNPLLVQRIRIPTTGGSPYPGIFVFQWDDPFNKLTSSGAKRVSTDYDVLVFQVDDSTGATTYRDDLSLTAVNGGAGGTNQAVEISDDYFDADTQFEIVIVRTNRAPAAGVTPNQATHIRWAMQTDAAQVIATYTTSASPNTYGHPCATGCVGTAAYVYDNGFDATDAVYHPQIEPFSSNGPAVIYLDNDGNRLSTPVIRKQPMLSTVDGVDTSFFGSDSDGDGLPNFFGTSAASPHAAGCAALLYGAAAGRGVTLTPAQVTSLLITTTQGQADQDPAVSRLTVGPLTFVARDRSTYTDPQAFNVSLDTSAGGALTALTIDQRTDTQPADGYFVPSAYPLTLGESNGSNGKKPVISRYALSSLSQRNPSAGQVLTLGFNNFAPGSNAAFGIASTNTGDTLAGATVRATVNGTTYTGTVANTTGKAWNYKSGYGLVDVQAAINKLLPTLPPKPAN